MRQKKEKTREGGRKVREEEKEKEGGYLLSLIK